MPARGKQFLLYINTGSCARHQSTMQSASHMLTSCGTSDLSSIREHLPPGAAMLPAGGSMPTRCGAFTYRNDSCLIESQKQSA